MLLIYVSLQLENVAKTVGDDLAYMVKSVPTIFRIFMNFNEY